MANTDGIELRKLVCNEEFKPRWEPYTLPDLGPDEVRVKSEFIAAKHGTEKGEVLGQAIYQHLPYLGDDKVFDRSKESPCDPQEWREVGNTAVGTVIAVGSEVEDLSEGDRVYGYAKFKTVQQGRGFKKLVDGLTPEAACCLDPAYFALAAVRDAQIRIGERVIVFGMGAIGLFVVQLARMSGALEVVAVDPIEARRELALQHGATKVVNPREVDDFGLASRAWFPGGADVTIEASGSYHALNQALRATRYGGSVVPLAFYLGEAKGVYLGEEFHFNLLNIVSARACSHPQRELHWDGERMFGTLIELFVQSALKPHGLPGPVVSPEELPEAYGKIRHAPDEVLKVAVRY
ncbi:MAG: zinc-binding alcohol dehydrogenase [Candidatus Latescibacteria bacterium]|nr:zinc-binding alcohol dehydrogenase [Candidatus Latescibacterota bacterium]